MRVKNFQEDSGHYRTVNNITFFDSLKTLFTAEKPNSFRTFTL